MPELGFSCVVRGIVESFYGHGTISLKPVSTLCRISFLTLFFTSDVVRGSHFRGNERQVRAVHIVTVDFEFYVPLSIMVFLERRPIIPIIAPGHLFKSITASMCTFYEKLFIQRALENSGYQVDSPQYTKIMKVTHISKSVKFLVRSLVPDISSIPMSSHRWLLYLVHTSL
jgi:hypothetical protein